VTLRQLGAPARPLTHGKRLIVTSQIFGCLIHVAIFVSMWGQPRELIWLAVLGVLVTCCASATAP
jgi:hypothetical protein